MRLIKITTALTLIIITITLIIFRTTNSFVSYNHELSPYHNDIKILLENAGWCWFQDPRSIIHDGKLIIGSVEGNGAGAIVSSVYDLKNDKLIGRSIIHDDSGHDDHNAPAFYARPDNTILAMYSLHNTNKLHYYKTSKTPNYLDWYDVKTYKHNYPKAKKVTYTNLVYLSSESILYNFFRGIGHDPSFIISLDHGNTWERPTHFLADDNEDDLQRPYANYTSNGLDTIGIVFTDNHPRRFGNSIYYAEYRNGNFYHANGDLIQNLKIDGPLKPKMADKVFEGGGGKGRFSLLKDKSAPKSTWTSSVVFDDQDRPHLGYTLYLSNSDHRYRMAYWNGEAWIDREVAFAGSNLYKDESSYTGLITLDPTDPRNVFISTDVDPITGKDFGGQHNIYYARVEAGDDINTINWVRLTESTSATNIRPVVVSGDGYWVLMWLRGRYTTYSNYDLDVAGIVKESHDSQHPNLFK